MSYRITGRRMTCDIDDDGRWDFGERWQPYVDEVLPAFAEDYRFATSATGEEYQGSVEWRTAAEWVVRHTLIAYMKAEGEEPIRVSGDWPPTPVSELPDGVIA